MTPLKSEEPPYPLIEVRFDEECAMKRSNGGIAMMLVVATAALSAMIVGDAVTADSDSRASSRVTGLDRSAIEMFDAFDLYWLGDAFEGLPLTYAAREFVARQLPETGGMNMVSFVYGSCDARLHGCAPPLEVQVWPACARNRSSYSLTPDGAPYPYEPQVIRSVPAGLYDAEDGSGRLELYPGDVTVVIFGDSTERLFRAAAALTTPDGTRTASDQMPPAAPGAVEGELVCTKAVEP